MEFQIGDLVFYKGKKAIIADRLNGTFALWDDTGKKELYHNGEMVDWVPRSELTK